MKVAKKQNFISLSLIIRPLKGITLLIKRLNDQEIYVFHPAWIVESYENDRLLPLGRYILSNLQSLFGAKDENKYKRKKLTKKSEAASQLFLRFVIFYSKSKTIDGQFK